MTAARNHLRWPLVAAVAPMLWLASPAEASWQSSGSWTGTGHGAALVAPTALTATCTTGSADNEVALSWTPGSSWADQVYAGGTLVSTRTDSTQTSVTDRVPFEPGKTHTWTVTAVIGSWTSASAQVTLTLDQNGTCPA